MTLLSGAFSSSAHAANVHFNFQDQDADQNPAFNYDLPAGFTGNADITVSGTLSSALTIDFDGMYDTTSYDVGAGYSDPNGSSLFGNNDPGADTITFGEPVTDVEFQISAWNAASPDPYSPVSGVNIVGSLDGQPQFTYSFPPGTDSDNASEWYSVTGGSASVNTITFNNFYYCQMGDLELTTAPEPASAALLLLASSFLLTCRPARRKPGPSG
jgi:hypothetical protein